MKQYDKEETNLNSFGGIGAKPETRTVHVTEMDFNEMLKDRGEDGMRDWFKESDYYAETINSLGPILDAEMSVTQKWQIGAKVKYTDVVRPSTFEDTTITSEKGDSRLDVKLAVVTDENGEFWLADNRINLQNFLAICHYMPDDSNTYRVGDKVLAVKMTDMWQGIANRGSRNQDIYYKLDKFHTVVNTGIYFDRPTVSAPIYTDGANNKFIRFC